MWDCHRIGGNHLSLCSIDSAIYGSCCSVSISPTSPGSEGENEEMNTVPVDESSESKPTSPIPLPASSSSMISEVPATNSPNVEIVPDYSEEDEHALEAEVSSVGNNSIPGSSDVVDEDTENQHESPINQIKCGISMRLSTSSVKKMRIIGGMDCEHKLN
jgi:hypothetical protein